MKILTINHKKQTKKAFTLIELLVTMGIIALMAVAVIPSFARFGEKSAFELQAAEIKSLITQANIMAKNPEQNIGKYIVKFETTGPDINTVALFKIDDTAENLIKKIKVPSNMSINQTGTNTNYFLVCNSPKGNCCNVSDVGASCSSEVNNTNFFELASDNSSIASLTFKLNSNPFRVEY